MNDETNLDIPPAAILSKLSLNISTPYRFIVSSCHYGLGKNTHVFID